MSEKKIERSASFIEYVIKIASKSKGIAASLKRADNPATEYQSWEHLATFGVDLEKDYQRLPHALIAASIAKAKTSTNGSAGMGEAIASCYPNGSESDQAKAKLRRLIACDSVEEVCQILRPLLQLIHSKSNKTLDYIRLLNELQEFNWNSQKVKTKWAQNFYRQNSQYESEEV